MPPFVRLGVARLETAPATLGQAPHDGAGVAPKGRRLFVETGDPETAARHLGCRTPDTTRINATWPDQSLRETIGRW